MRVTLHKILFYIPDDTRKEDSIRRIFRDLKEERVIDSHRYRFWYIYWAAPNLKKDRSDRSGSRAGLIDDDLALLNDFVYFQRINTIRNDILRLIYACQTQFRKCLLSLFSPSRTGKPAPLHL